MPDLLSLSNSRSPTRLSSVLSALEMAEFKLDLWSTLPYSYIQATGFTHSLG